MVMEEVYITKLMDVVEKLPREKLLILVRELMKEVRCPIHLARVFEAAGVLERDEFWRLVGYERVSYSVGYMVSDTSPATRCRQMHDGWWVCRLTRKVIRETEQWIRERYGERIAARIKVFLKVFTDAYPKRPTRYIVSSVVEEMLENFRLEPPLTQWIRH